MQLLNGIYDAALLLYALSLLFIFSDCLKRNPGGKRLGTGLLAVTGLLQLAGLAVRFSQEGGLPIFTPYDFLFWFSFIIVLTSLALAFTRGGEFTILLISGAGFSVFLLNRVWLTAADHGLESWRAVHGWLAMHIILANLSFGALTLGTAFAIMYLFLHTKLKSKNGMTASAVCRVWRRWTNIHIPPFLRGAAADRVTGAGGDVDYCRGADTAVPGFQGADHYGWAWGIYSVYPAEAFRPQERYGDGPLGDFRVCFYYPEFPAEFVV